MPSVATTILFALDLGMSIASNIRTIAPEQLESSRYFLGP